MTLRNYFAIFLFSFLAFVSCKDDEPVFIPVPERDRTEQQVVDRDSLIGYLETHYFNSGDFEAVQDYSIDDIVITELPQDDNGNYLPLPNPDENTLLIDAVTTHNTTYFDVEYEYYILQIAEGFGDENPKFTDLVELVFSGNFLDEVVFDSTVNPNNPLDLLGVIEGWRQVIPQFKTASSFIVNDDGTVAYSGYGTGVMFLPSGLGYYASPPSNSGVPVYSNLIFKFELYRSQHNDHDQDGIYSHLEDLNSNNNVFDDNTDLDDFINCLDADDDGDGVLTIHEDLDEDGDPTNDDSDGDDIPNYLDADSTESNQDN